MSGDLSFFKPEYRIVRDNYCGFEVQIRRWYWPFWSQVGFTNTHSTVEAAESYATSHAQGQVKYLGRFRPTPTDTGGR
jgi:hypothetical protein